MRVLFFFQNSENLGIEYLSASLKKAGHQTDLLFDPSAEDLAVGSFRSFVNFSFETIRRKIDSYQPNLIAFSLYTNTFPWFVKIAQFIKQNFTIPIVVGGPHATILPDYIMKKPFVDYLIRGEGEIAIVELLSALDGKIPFSAVPNLCYKEADKILENPRAELIKDLDDLPFPDKDLFWKFGAFHDRYYMMASRGCPNQCTYCINHQIQNLYPSEKRVRQRSVGNVIKELLWAKKRYPIKSIYFYDDIFITNKKWLRNFILEYRRAEISLPFKILVHPSTVDKKSMKLLKKIGCIDIDMGIESGSERIRREIFNRQISNDKLVKSAKTIMDAGIRLTTLNIINNPTETPLDMFKTYIINRQIKPHGVLITSLYPYPNTDIALIAKREGYIDQEEINLTYEGVANYHNKSLINHPYKDIGERIRLLGPLAIKFPRYMEPLIFALPINKVTSIIHLLFATSFQNAWIKGIEYFKMLWISRRFYQTQRYLKKENID